VLGRRQELKAHADVLSAACVETSVVPFVFGTVLPDDEAVRQDLLVRHAQHLQGELDRLRDLLQFNLRLTAHEDRLLADVMAASPELTRLNEHVRALPPGQGQAHRLRLGEEVAQRFRAAAERVGAAAVDSLGSLATDVRVEEIGSQDGGSRASFLVARAQVSEFLRAAESLAERLDARFACRLLGPLPPFAFVTSLPSAGTADPGREPTWA
jgi:gas vesicle protein GvpL/GvpF